MGEKEKIKITRKRLKAHIKNKGTNTDFHITESLCYHWWHKLNFAVFDSKLTPPVRFELRAFRACGGWCIPWRLNSLTPKVRMGISTEIWERKSFLTVLAHEMVHQWEWEIERQWCTGTEHGKSFYAWKNKLKTRAGLPLSKIH